MKQAAIMVKLSVDGSNDFMGIKTYDRPHGSHGRFLIAHDALSQILGGPKGMTHHDSDCGHFAEACRVGVHLWFRITWLSHYEDGAVTGFQQIFAIPVKTIRCLLTSGGNAKLLHAPACTPVSIGMSPLAAKSIRRFIQNKRIRRAFSKAMRDCFDWPGEHITLYRDGKYSFYFTARSGFPKCGGLILHESEKDGHPYIYYSVHT